MLTERMRGRLVGWWRFDVVLAVVGAAALLGGAASGALPLDLTEALGFVTGAACVWLTVRQHIWNFPLGIANNAFLAILFLDRALYADMTLQLVYILLGLHGWYSWLRGGRGHAALAVSRATPALLLALAALVALGTAGMIPVLQAVAGKAPFWDALTTALSLAAQYLLNRKRLENWYLWLAVDLIYIPLYLATGLPLTALLYALFLALCVAGWRAWRRDLARAGQPQAAEAVAA